MNELAATGTTVMPAKGVLLRARERAVAARIPLAGTFELTTRCNLRCVHCYQPDRAGRAGEISGAALRKLVDEAVHAGCLDVLLTGGEPLLRRDFAGIYRYVREKGTLVTVFTNATLVDDATVSLFRELPPNRVEVSVYGATRETYEAVTGVPGSFARCMEGVERMLMGGVKVALKTVVLRRNAQEVPALAELASSLGLPFRTDAVINNRLDGDPAPLAERVDPAVAARIELTDEGRRSKLAAHLERWTRGSSPAVYRCDAGVTAFYVSARGRMRPCLLTTDMESDAVGEGFPAAWRRVTEAIRVPTWSVDGACRNCANLPICGYCPALIRLERGSATRSSDFLCELGRERRMHLAGIHEAGAEEKEQERVH